ncbi:MAG: TRAP transporter substrate-binding protein DctP [bacterium]|nr:TRAP transporter substrate-binding protein DctP [bacterium]
MTKKIFLLVPWLGAFILLFFTTGTPAQEKTGKPEFTLKWGTIAPEATSWGGAIGRVNALMEKESRGRIKNTWYFGAVMGDEMDMIRKVKIGQLQGLAVLTVGLQKIAPETGVLTLPFMFKDYREVDCTYPKIWKLLGEAFEKHGFVLLGHTDVCFAIMQTHVSPEMENELRKDILVNGKISDPTKNEIFLRYLKQWAWQTLDIDAYLYKMMGITNVIPLQVTDVLTALQTGMVNSVYGSCSTTVALQWQTYINYIIKFGGYEGVAYAPAMLVLDKKAFYSLPPDLQKIVRDAYQTELGPGSSRLTLEVREVEANMCQGMKNRGTKEIVMDSELTKIFEEKSRPIYKMMEGKYYPPEFRQAVEKARDECRASLGNN